MQNRSLTPSIERPYSVVNTPVSTQLPLLPDSMIHHNPLPPRVIGRTIIEVVEKGKRYGVSSSHRVLSPTLFFKKFDAVRDFLQYTLGLSCAERETTLRLLRYWAYYGQVYVKEAEVTAEPGCSKATYWRTITKLKETGLLQLVNRFLIRPHAQISNLYRLDKLVLMIAKYLAEHGAKFTQEWLQPYLLTPWADFWDRSKSIFRTSAGDGLLPAL